MLEMDFATLWEAYADATPDVSAVLMGDKRLSWCDYEIRAAKLASALTASGLGPDDKAGLYLYNSLFKRCKLCLEILSRIVEI